MYIYFYDFDIELHGLYQILDTVLCEYMHSIQYLTSSPGCPLSPVAPRFPLGPLAPGAPSGPASPPTPYTHITHHTSHTASLSTLYTTNIYIILFTEKFRPQKNSFSQYKDSQGLQEYQDIQ